MDGKRCILWSGDANGEKMFQIKLALKYLRGRKKIFFSFSNLLSFLGIFLGVFSLLVVSSVMNGFDTDMRNRVIGLKAEIKIHNDDFSPIKNYQQIVDKVSKNEKILGVTPVCETELMIQNGDKISSTICYGIDYNKHKKVTNIMDKIVIGMPNENVLKEDGIIIGLELSLTLSATVGEYVQLSSPIGTQPTPFGLLPKTKKLKVVGIFSSGMPEYDRVFTFISLQNGQYLLNLDDEISHLELKTHQSKKSIRVANLISEELGKKFIVEDWSDFESNLFNAIKMEKIVMLFVLALMIIIASFNMTGNFIKLVTEKKTEIGILKTIGASEKDIVNIFITIGSIIGIVGTFIGTSAAYFLLFLQNKFHFIQIPISGFPLQWLPVEIRIIDFIFIPLFAIIISFFTTFSPAKKTVKIDPIKIIRTN